MKTNEVGQPGALALGSGSAPRLTWRKGKRRSGMMRLAKTYRLCRGDEELATVQETGSLWFWYGGGMNTAHKPTDLETAKRDAKAHILSLPNVQSEPRGGQTL